MLKHTLKLPVNIDVESRFPAGGGWEPVYTVRIDKMTAEQRSEALKAIEAYNAPLPDKVVISLMARLAVISPERDKTAIDTAARAAIWCEELRKYPADVVNKALRARYRWFPSLAEVLEKCDNEVAYRKLIEMGIRCYRTGDED